MRASGLIIALSFVFAHFVYVGPAQAAKPEFKDDQHCVAYFTKKKMFLVRNVEVVGKNCNVETKLTFSEKGFALKLSAPIAKFKSGEADRDKEVELILQAKKQPNIEFESKSFSQDQWIQWIGKGSGKIAGELVIASKRFPVNADVKITKTASGFTVQGTIPGKFSDYKIKPPSVGGGMVANVKDFLELHFHLQARSTDGFTGSLLDQMK